jgi:Leucine-rich repeat (LRR) protein
LRELAVALAVNKDWSSSVQSMRSALLSFDGSSEQLSALLDSFSLLRRHVAQIGQWDETHLRLLSNQLSSLAHALPQLRSLCVCLRLVSSAPPLSFPAQLQRLSVFFGGPEESATTKLLAAIGQLPRLHSLRLRLLLGKASLAPLQQLPLLRDLQLTVSFRDHIAGFAADLRALSWLHRLSIGALPGSQDQEQCVALFTALLRDAPEEQMRGLQWREFNILHLNFTDELTPLLCRLPLLERLEADLSDCSRFEFLSALPRLTHLDLQFRWMSDGARRNLLCVFTSDGLTRLHALSVRGGPCSSDDLSHLLSHTPSLTRLLLHDLPLLTSLCFFRRLPHLSQTLTQLTLECSRYSRLIVADLSSLFALKRLRQLRLINWPNHLSNSPTAEERAPFEQRPCSVLPQLEVFQWTQRPPCY